MKHVIPQDSTYLPGMKTLMADPTDHLNVRYFPDVEYVRRGEKALHLQLLMPAGVAPGELSGDPKQIQSRRCPWIVYVQGAAWGEQDVYGSLPRLVRMAESSSSLVAPVISVVKYCFWLQNRLIPRMVSRKNEFS